jgi:glycosyltransferase involved in cell wall biosynthesis
VTTVVSQRQRGTEAVAEDRELEVRLETELPPFLPAGRGTAIFCFGTCFHRRLPVRRLTILVDGVEHPVSAARMPRLDLFRSLHPTLAEGEEGSLERDPLSGDDPNCLSYRSGFWATVPIQPGDAADTIELRALARLADGTTAEAPLGAITVVSPPPPPSPAPPGRGRLIAICLATFNPRIELFRRQIGSIRAQSDTDWVCLISDDCSRPERFAEIEKEVEGDPRFVVSRSRRRLGFYRNFERSLEMLPAEAELVALCDQDDRWYPDKLEVLRKSIGDAQLVYSDQRLVDPAGRVLAETYWTTRRNNHTNLASLLIANTITGAASLFRREVVDLALPFPDPPGEQYHDHWLGLVALATGKASYVDRPLYDYVQHGGAALGHTDANVEFRPGEHGGWRRLRGWRDSFDAWHGYYFNGYLRLQVLAEVLLARCAGRISRRRQRALRRFISGDRSPFGFAWLLLRPLRRRFGRNETLGAEKMLTRGIVWRHVLAARAGRMERPDGHLEHDASLPPIAQRLPAHGNAATADLERRIEPLELAVSERAPERVNLLIPTIDLKHLFGGYIAKYNLARKLAEKGLRIRLVSVDPTPALPRDWKRQVESYSGLRGTFENVEVAFARDRDRPLEIHPADRFVATTWWTAHIAHEAVGHTERERFLYLIQEYEPFTFVMGSWAAAALTTYEFPHVALFSTELLRRFFAERGHGVYAQGRSEGDRRSASFENAITAVEPPAAEELAARSSRRFLFYARPAQHTARNMFELGLMSLAAAVEEGVFEPDWELHGVGGSGIEGRIPLTGAVSLHLLPQQSQDGYAELLAKHDVGLALMLTPHPSLVPIEMASAGMLTVTNSFETKTAGALRAISPNLIAVPPSPEGVLDGLRAAVARADDYRGRAEGAAVAWSRDWEESFSDDVMDRIVGLLGQC